MQLIKNFLDAIHLRLSPINDHRFWSFPAFCSETSEASTYYFFHGRDIIRANNRFDFEFAIEMLCWFAVEKHCHGCNGTCSGYVRVVICLNATIEVNRITRELLDRQCVIFFCKQRDIANMLERENLFAE